MKSYHEIELLPLMTEFAEATRNSRSPDGDWQGDGWGACWLNESGDWSLYKSLLPIWEDTASFSLVSATHYLLIHARSASFPKDKAILEYNQPYVNKEYAFVFNGLLKGVKIPIPLEGTIGAQKIWSLTKKILSHSKPHDALISLKETLFKYSSELYAMNIGLCDKSNFYCMNLYQEHPDYYQFRHYASQQYELISSVELCSFMPVEKNNSSEIIVFS
jgi:predicted glutamine amidotransferase